MRRRDEQPTAQTLERWESWPLWALGLSNGLNIVLWYVLSMARVQAPELPIRVLSALADYLPFIAALGGAAQALALDGALIATIAGARHGRRGLWTWVTILFTGLFSAAISFALHSGQIDQLPFLHVASAVNMIFYNMHLAQKKDLQFSEKTETTITKRPETAVLAKSRSQSADRVSVPIRDNFSCKTCGKPFQTLTDVSAHARKEHPKRN